MMNLMKRGGFLAVWLVLLAGQWTGHAQPAGARLIDDVEGAFARIQVVGAHLTARTNGLIPEPRYRTSMRNWFGLLNHFQGIQRLPDRNYLILSGSNPRSSAAELFVVRLDGDTGDVVARIGVDSAMWHAGGLSTIGRILAVPLHGASPRHAKVVFYDVSDPEHPVRLPVEIDRPGRKASAVAITDLPNGRFLAAVLSAYDGLPRRIDFYLSRSAVLEDGFLPGLVTWHVRDVTARVGQERTFSHFQGLNFVRQTDGRLYLVGFHNSVASPAVLPGRDYADLYEVAFPAGTLEGIVPALARPDVIKTANRLLRCTGGYCNMDAAAGLFVDAETQSLSVYAAPGWLSGNVVRTTVYRGAPPAR